MQQKCKSNIKQYHTSKSEYLHACMHRCDSAVAMRHVNVFMELYLFNTRVQKKSK